MNKRIITFILTLALVLSLFPFSVVAKSEESAVATPKAQVSNSYGDDVIITPAQSKFSYFFTWESDFKGNERLQISESSKLVNGEFPADATTLSAQKISSIRYTAKIEGLTPNTEYSYRVGSGTNTWSKVYTLSTYEEDNSFSFIFAADPQIGVYPDIDTRAWCGSLDKLYGWFEDEVEFLMCAGDQINSVERDIEYNVYKAPEAMRSLPQIVTVGNHDDGANHSYNFVYENVDQSTLTDAGVYGGDFWLPYDGVLILNLNMNHLSLALHEAFIKNAIAEYTALYGEPLWTMALFHQPFYSAGVRGEFSETEEMRAAFAPVMSELGVDVVLNGHDHTYTRSYMINGTDVIDDASLYTEVNGDPYGSYYNPKAGDVLYLTGNSASGSKYYKSYPQPYSAVANQENIPTLTKIDVTADSIAFTTYRTGENNEIGDALDFFAIHRDSKTDTVAPKLVAPKEVNYIPNSTNSVLKGIRAYDNKDGDITDKIEVKGKLDPLGEATLTFTVSDKAGNTSSATTTFIPYGTKNIIGDETKWKYLDDGSVPFESNDDIRWTTDDYDTSAWKEGVAPFGAYNGSVDGFNEKDFKKPNTLLNQYYPEDSEDAGFNISTFFFKTSFDVEDPERVTSLTLTFQYNDAVDFYVNGVLLHAHGTESIVDKAGYSGTGAPEEGPVALIKITDKELIKSLNLKKEGNVLAVQLFQFSIYSEDIYFYMHSMSYESSPEPMSFKDVSKSAWYYSNVARAYDKGLFVGTSETEFSPKATMTRAAVWTVLARIAGADVSVSSGKWYAAAQKWAMDNGVSDGTMPNAAITREQFAKMLWSMQGEPETANSLASFADGAKVSSWAREGLSWAVNQGLIEGRSGNKLAPKDNASRAEACTLLLRYTEN